MPKAILLALLGLILLPQAPVESSPTRGSYREPYLRKEKRGRLEAGETYEFRDVFRANQRACVIVEGDHDPIMNLEIKVLDQAGNLVAADTAGGDFIAVMWYPPRTQEYRIVIRGDGDRYNDLDIVVK